MLDRWRWADWGDALRDLDRRRTRLARLSMAPLGIAALVATAWVATSAPVPVTIAVAAWGGFATWLGGVAAARGSVAVRRRSVLAEVRAADPPALAGLASDELERLVVTGRTESRGALVKAEVEGDVVRVTKGEVPPSLDGDPTVGWTAF